MTLDLAGKTAFVTGAASGIGAACSLEFARAGAFVFLADCRSPSKTIDAIQRIGGQAIAIPCDISDEASVRAAFLQVTTSGRSLDVTLNSAGILLEKDLLDTRLNEFERIAAVNIRGCFLVGREALRLMAPQGHGRLINIASELAHLGRSGFSVYCASKAAVIGFTRAWAREFAPAVQVNAIAPGPVDTPMLDLENLSPKWRDKEADLPMQRVGTPAEIAVVAGFLANPQNSFMTGQTLNANGGAVLI